MSYNKEKALDFITRSIAKAIFDDIEKWLEETHSTPDLFIQWDDWDKLKKKWLE